jgi:hypothetical protein
MQQSYQIQPTLKLENSKIHQRVILRFQAILRQKKEAARLIIPLGKTH